MNNETSKLGQHFKETFSDFKAEPSPDVWENIAQHPSLSPAPIAKPGLFTPAKIIIGAAVITTVAVVSWLTLTREPDTTPITITEQSTITKLDNTATDNISHTTPSTSQPEMNPASRSTSKNERADITIHKSKSAEQAISAKNTTLTEQATVLQPKSLASPFSGITVKPADQANASPTRNPETSPEPLPAKADIASSPIEISPDQVICNGESVSLWATGGESYLWNNGETTSSITVSPAVTSAYTVSVTDAVGEVISEDIEVKVSNCQDIYVPNAFTPDGDNLNDHFNAFGENIQKFNMMIFARQGQTVFETNDISQGWDGKVRGSMGEPGVYIYKITYTNAAGESRVKTGQVNLIR